MSSKIYALILAGGSGERFWPLSRKTKPKQLLSLFSEKTLLEDTIDRLEGLVEPDHILILTNQDQEAAVRAIAKKLPKDNIVAEPAKRDTAAAIALGVGWVSMRDRSATMIVLPADHLIQDVAGFQKTLRAAAAAAEQSGELVTIGIKPTWACPGFGYIEQGKNFDVNGMDGASVCEVERFREKPNTALAETFLKQGNFRWNAGMFIWTIPSILSAFHRHTPELARFVEQLHESKDLARALKEVFPHLPKISIDYAVMEKAARALVVDAGFDWDDVGSWTAAAKYWKQDEQENICNAGGLTTVDSSNNIVYTNQKIHFALMGVNNLIIVQTGDSILIANRHEAEKIKNLVSKVPPELQ